MTSSGIEYPNYQVLVNNKDGYRTEMRCHEKSGITIECSFEQMVIRHLNTEKDEKFLESLKTEDNHYIQALLKKTEVLNCNNIHREGETEEELSWDKERCREFIKSKNRASLINFFEKNLDRTKQTCILSHLKFSEEFRYDPKKSRWMDETLGSEEANPVNRACGLVNISYLEKDPREEYNKFSWNLVANNIVTKKSESFFGARCSLLDTTAQGGEVSYGVGSGQYGTSTLMNCKYINFSELY
ncbi:MAG: exported protein of unknown function [Gammaproteobacteria bacterium]|jgi:hypothetical protein|nr:exported protein of unknown function [Gammaproteobacteria bacterium]